MRAKGVDDADLHKVLKLLEMDHLIEREGGWDTVQEWRDALSGEHVTSSRSGAMSDFFSLQEGTSSESLWLGSFTTSLRMRSWMNQLLR